ncbi:MAG: Gfo/Idh/MocA family oxidoreductase, partial [Verrucomicrobiota bacterium]
MEYQVMNWYYFNWLCGDHITEQHIHNLDVVNWFFDDYPVSAQGMGGREVRKRIPGNDSTNDFGQIFDHHYVEFTYPDGSICNSQCRHIKGCFNRVAETFVGTKGRVSIGDIRDLKGNRLWRHRGRGDANPYQVEHNELHRHIREDIALNNAYYGAKSSMTSILGRLATYSGKVVKWDDAINSDVDLFPERLSWDAMPRVLPDADGNYPVPVPGSNEKFV